jgi:predicted patatin/cPLA2 family phospholipase
MRGRKYTSQNREKYGTLERNQTAAERAAENKSEKNIRGMKMDGKNRKKLRALYEEGYQEAARRKEELIAFLEK